MNFEVGQLVKYSKPQNDAERAARFTVLEFNPARNDSERALLKVQSTKPLTKNGVLLPVEYYEAHEYEAVVCDPWDGDSIPENCFVCDKCGLTKHEDYFHGMISAGAAVVPVCAQCESNGEAR